MSGMTARMRPDVASTEEIRSHFPALERRQAGKAVAYFDAPGGTQVPRGVAQAMTDYLFHHNANTHWGYPTSDETDAIIEGGREAAADLLHASPGEIVFGANMTTLTFHLARALGRTWRKGDEVVVTELDHHANVAPWRALETDRGIVVRTARMIEESAQIDYQHLAQLVGPKTRLVAIGGASNAVGTINDLERAAAVARSAKALLFVDAVHLAPHELIDVQRIDCDFLACSAYKFYGPHVGILFGRHSLLESLPFPKLVPAPDSAPERAETGTQNQEGIAGVAAAVDFLASLSAGGAPPAGGRRGRLVSTFSALHERGAELTRMLWNGLQSIPGVRIYGPSPEKPRTPTIAFTIEGMTAAEVSRALVDDALFASHGDFYASTVTAKFGLADRGLLRVGCACYTSEDEVGRLVKAVERITTNTPS
jgi:cysteine desulfurase family protein (TIGR01976 family)